MKTILKITLTLFFVIALQGTSFSQGNFPGVVKREQTIKEQNLLTQLSEAKNSGEMTRIQEIQSELDIETGSTTKTPSNYTGTFVLVNEPFFHESNINIVEISQLKGVRALSTVTEQRGQNIGRIWVAAAVSNSTARDTIYYFRSDDGGISWVTYGYLILANSDEVNFDQMDMEIIEDNIGDKYLWLFYGLTAINGKQFIGAAILKTPNFMANEIILLWPGENLSNTNFNRFRPRITSDNAKYSNTSSLYISTSFDTIDGNSHGGNYDFAKCNNPYTITPLITYINFGGLAPQTNNPTDLHSDIAYINNGGDSIIFVGSNIFTAPYDIVVAVFNTSFGLLNSVVTLPNLSGFNKEFARISCSGGANQPEAMFVFRENYQNSGDWDLKGYRTNNGGTNWSAVNIDIRRDNVVIPYPAEISSVRNRNGRFNIAYTLAGPSNYDTVKYIFTNSGSPNMFTRTVNHLSGFQRPKPGIRLVDNDSCFAVWSQKGNGTNIWASEGCNGQISIGIENTGYEIPTAYSLNQNYPNPFNPVTNIKFSIPNSGNVKLTVFDITGREVETLINENLNAGIYKVDWNASNYSSGVYFYKLESENFTDTRKMMMIK
ncbi:MAG: T9SS type A sorting domain-containing protein [Ignavibacteria bacterium]